MTAVGSEDSTLAPMCLDLCQALVSKGLAFTFSLTTSSGFTISLDTRGEGSPSPVARKPPSPSTLRRNARRRQEFLQRKAKAAPVTPKDKPAVPDSWSSVLVNGGSGSKSVTMKLKKNPQKIPQLDGSEEMTKEAEAQTETKPEASIKATQTDRAAPVLDICQVQQTNIPAHMAVQGTVPWQPPETIMGPYRPPHSRKGL